MLFIYIESEVNFFLLLVLFLPWAIKRRILCRIWGYQIHPTAYIGISYVFPKHLVMDAGAKIGHLNVCVHLDSIKMGANATIGRSNWITGFPSGTSSEHFKHDTSRKSELVIGRESAITKNHHIDCTNKVEIGDFVTVAGYSSQILTHSIDIYEGRQDSHPISIGDYCFVSTGVIILGGSSLPSHSVLAAGAVLNKKFDQSYAVYGGVPARFIKSVPIDAKYMCRKVGFVW